MTEQTLIHGVFNPSSVVQTELWTRLAANGYKPKQFRWLSSETAPAYTDDPEVVVVLVATLGTLQETLEFYFAWAISHHHEHFLSPHFLADSKRMRLWKSEFQPNTIQWVRLKLNENFGQSPQNVRKTLSYLPGVEVLAALAEHPERARESNGTRERPYLWMGGIEIYISGYGQWASVPDLWFDASGSQLSLSVHWASFAYSDTAVPCVVGGT